MWLIQLLHSVLWVFPVFLPFPHLVSDSQQKSRMLCVILIKTTFIFNAQASYDAVFVVQVQRFSTAPVRTPRLIPLQELLRWTPARQTRPETKLQLLKTEPVPENKSTSSPSVKRWRITSPNYIPDMYAVLSIKIFDMSFLKTFWLCLIQTEEERGERQGGQDWSHFQTRGLHHPSRWGTDISGSWNSIYVFLISCFFKSCTL